MTRKIPEPDLQTAVWQKNLDLIRRLIESGVDVDQQFRGKRTALMEACGDGYHEVLELLLEFRPNLDHQDYLGYTALHYACQNSHIDIARKLLAAGATVDVEDAHGNTPLFKAVFNWSDGDPDYQLVRLLVAAGADRTHVNKHGQTPEGLAAIIAGRPPIRWE